jgi:hypothetical protein
MAFTHASGPVIRAEFKPASAFTRGDLLCFNSSSSVSRINELMASGDDIVGVAAANSTQSINGKVVVEIPMPGSQWYASTHTATSSAMTPGQPFDVSYALANGGQYVTTSATSARVVIVKGTIGTEALDQSVESRVLVQFIHNAGNLAIS